MPRQKLRLQTVILALVLGTLAGTLVIIGFAARRRLMAAGTELKQKYDALTSDMTSREVLRLGEGATRALRQFRNRVEREDLLALEFDPQTSGLSECLFHMQSLTWISYSRARDGQFVGFRRMGDDELVLNESNPQKDRGKPREFRLRDAGAPEPLPSDLPGGYDPRTKEWFTDAAQAKGEIVWTKPYRFHDGEVGLTAAVACISRRDGQLLGVLTADYALSSLDAHLERLIAGHRRLVAVTTDHGHVIAFASSLRDVGNPQNFLAGIATRLQRPLEQLPDDTPVAIEFKHDGGDATAVYRIYRRGAMPPFVTVVIAPDVEFYGLAQEHVRITAMVGAGAVLLALLVVIPLSRRLSRPLEQVSQRLERVAQFHLPTEDSPDSVVREIAIVGDSVDRMTAGLRSFGRYVPTTLVRELLQRKEFATRGGEDRTLTILFADLAGFTTLSENLTPQQVVEELGEYFEHATRAIETDRDGTLDKFIGDGVLGFFNAPHDLPDHARHGCLAALQLRDALAAQRPAHQAAGRPGLRSRIGLHTGEVMVGNIGTSERFAYTILGDAANLASRLESLNKLYGTDILASDQVHVAAGPGFEWRRIDHVAVYGRGGATEIFELLGETGTVEASRLSARASYEAALEDYAAGRFQAALISFEAHRAMHPWDRAAVELHTRCTEFIADGPPPNWKGIHVLREK